MVFRIIKVIIAFILLMVGSLNGHLFGIPIPYNIFVSIICGAISGNLIASAFIN